MKKILIVDDNNDILEATSLVLKEHKYKVETLTDASKVYDYLNEFQPNIVFLDIYMSGYDGRQICQEIKKKKQYGNMKVIMFSAHPTAIKQIKDYQGDGFLKKPFNIKDILNIIEEK